MYLCVCPSTSTSVHIAFPPTTGGVSLPVWVDASNVDSVNDGPYLEGNRAIRKGVNNRMRSRVGLLIFVFGTDVEHDFVTSTILMRDSRCVLPFVVLEDQLLLPLSNKLPVGGVLDVKDQVSTEHHLSWALAQSCVISAPYSEGCCT